MTKQVERVLCQTTTNPVPRIFRVTSNPAASPASPRASALTRPSRPPAETNHASTTQKAPGSLPRVRATNPAFKSRTSAGEGATSIKFPKPSLIPAVALTAAMRKPPHPTASMTEASSAPSNLLAVTARASRAGLAVPAAKNHRKGIALNLQQ